MRNLKQTQLDYRRRDDGDIVEEQEEARVEIGSSIQPSLKTPGLAFWSN